MHARAPVGRSPLLTRSRRAIRVLAVRAPIFLRRHVDARGTLNGAMPDKPGRPPLDSRDPSVSVHLRLPAHEYDRLYARASAARVTVPELLRQQLRGLDDDPDDE